MGWAEGPAAATVALPWPWATHRRLLVWNGGGPWQLLDGGCHPSAGQGEAQLFLLDGRVWQARNEGDRLIVGPITGG